MRKIIIQLALDRSPDKIMVPEMRKCVNEVPVEQPEEEEIRSDSGLGYLQVLHLWQG